MTEVSFTVGGQISASLRHCTNDIDWSIGYLVNLRRVMELSRTSCSCKETRCTSEERLASYSCERKVDLKLNGSWNSKRYRMVVSLIFMSQEERRAVEASFCCHPSALSHFVYPHLSAILSYTT